MPSRQPLPFLNNSALETRSVNELYETMGSVVTGKLDITKVGRDTEFSQRSSLVKIGRLNLAAAASTSIFVRREVSPDITLRIATRGHCTHTIGKKQISDRAGESAVFLSGAGRSGINSDDYVCVMPALQRDVLLATAEAMLGPDRVRNTGAINLIDDRQLSLNHGSLRIGDLLQQYFSLIDSMAGQPGMLSMLNLDDAINRCVVMLLNPSLFLDKVAPPRVIKGTPDPLDTVCDYVKERLHHPLGLTEMERVSGMSSRTLQYAFMHRFQCTPMAWVRRERLNLARRLLQQASAQPTITQLALDCGFANPGLFAKYYRERFGELPSDTQLRALRG